MELDKRAFLAAALALSTTACGGSTQAPGTSHANEYTPESGGERPVESEPANEPEVAEDEPETMQTISEPMTIEPAGEGYIGPTAE